MPPPTKARRAGSRAQFGSGSGGVPRLDHMLLDLATQRKVVPSVDPELSVWLAVVSVLSPLYQPPITCNVAAGSAVDETFVQHKGAGDCSRGHELQAFTRQPKYVDLAQCKEGSAVYRMLHIE